MDNSIQAQGKDPLRSNSAYLSIAEAAYIKGQCEDAIRRLIKRHHELTINDVCKREHFCTITGLTRKMTTISKECFLRLIGEQNIKSIQPELQNRHDVGILQGKRKMVKQAIDNQFIASNDPILANLQQMMLVRQKQLQQQEEIDSLKSQVLSIVQDREQAEKELLSLPAPNVEAPKLTERALIRKVINIYAQTKNGNNYKATWLMFYSAVYYRLKINLKRKGLNPLDVLEKEGALAEAYALACEIFKL